MEDLASMLDRDNTPRTKARSITAAIDFIKDRHLWIARHQKIRMERMRDPPLDRASGRDQSLAKDLASENTLRTVFRGYAAKDVLFDLFQIEQRQEFFDRFVGVVRGHSCP